jgi:hypothetical protein
MVNTTEVIRILSEWPQWAGKESPGPFFAALEGEKRIFWGICRGSATADTPNPEKEQSPLTIF